MAEIPEHLLRRSAEAKAKALGVPVEEVIAEMKGEAPPAPTPSGESADAGVPDVAPADSSAPVEAPASDEESVEAAVAVAEEPPSPAPASNGGVGAISVSPRPSAPAEGIPEGVRPSAAVDGRQGRGDPAGQADAY